MLPGLGDVTQLAGHIAPPRAQRARFTSPRITRGMEIIGAPGVRLHVRGSRDEAVLFVRLLDLGAHGQQHLVRGLVAPVRISGIPPLRGAASRVVDVRLAPIAWRVAPGHRLAIEVATTDAAYRAARPAASYRVAVDDATGLRVPVATMRHAMLTPITEGGERTAPFTRIGASVGVAALLALLAGAIVTHHRRRRRGACEASPPTGAPIEARGLTKRYRTSRRRAVDDVDLTIRPGRIVGLVGPNGAGKTTMLRMLVGLTRPSCGCAWLFGEPVEPGVGALRRVGVFIDGPGLDQHATMRQQLHRYARVAGRPHDRQAIDRALAHVDLLDRAEQRISTASHGMRQRLGIAQALLGDPELVILDEPANGLDPLQIHQLRLLLRAIADEGRTVLVSSHILSELELLCDDAVLILDGRVAAAGPIADVTGAHASLEAALLANIQHPEPT